MEEFEQFLSANDIFLSEFRKDMADTIAFFQDAGAKIGMDFNQQLFLVDVYFMGRQEGATIIAKRISQHSEQNYDWVKLVEFINKYIQDYMDDYRHRLMEN